MFTSNIHVRLATESDLSTIMRIVDDARVFLRQQEVPQWQEAYPAREDFLNDIKLSQLYVAEIGDLVLAMAALSFEEDANYDTMYEGAWRIAHPSLVIHRLAVSKKAYGTGLGKSLLHFAEHLALKHNVISLKADTHPKNPTMNSLLEKMGYVRVGRIVLARSQSDPNRWAYEKILDNAAF